MCERRRPEKKADLEPVEGCEHPDVKGLEARVWMGPDEGWVMVPCGPDESPLRAGIRKVLERPVRGGSWYLIQQ